MLIYYFPKKIWVTWKETISVFLPVSEELKLNTSKCNWNSRKNIYRTFDSLFEEL